MKKIFAWIVAFALCFSLLLTGCNEFSGNYSRQLTAEELDTKLSGADLEDFDSAASGTEVTGYQMKFDTGISISVKVDETDTEMEIDGNGEVKYTFGEEGFALYSKAETIQSGNDETTELHYVDGVLYTKIDAKRNGLSYSEKTKQEIPSYIFDFSDTQAVTIDVGDLLEAVRTGGAQAYCDATDGNKIKIVLDGNAFLSELKGLLQNVVPFEMNFQIGKCVAETYLKLREDGTLCGYKIHVDLEANIAAEESQQQVAASLIVKLNTQITEFGGKISAPSDAASYAE